MDCRVCTQGPYECIIIMKAMLYHMLPPSQTILIYHEMLKFIFCVSILRLLT